MLSTSESNLYLSYLHYCTYTGLGADDLHPYVVLGYIHVSERKLRFGHHGNISKVFSLISVGG